ncbi:hypothetical protein SAMN04488548_1342056 [Gordonia westfalica]|uniref:Uncharacterized protein n=1 Tax=Gordonia westfalica TaxID=158898 RepID=A0A1H2JFL9_9ACTN|nr:hypothetical protein SAMN04488548_1342056 [Gordonia westfalica]
MSEFTRSSYVYNVNSSDLADLVGTDTIAVVVASGLILVWGLALGVWKYHGIRTSPSTARTCTSTSLTERH